MSRLTCQTKALRLGNGIVVQRSLLVNTRLRRGVPNRESLKRESDSPIECYGYYSARKVVVPD